MIARKNSPQIPEFPNMPKSNIHDMETRSQKAIVNSRRPAYKGGRRLACGARLEIWRTTEGYSQLEVANKLVDVARESTSRLSADSPIAFESKYMLDKVQEFEYGRSKPPTWIVLLMMRAYSTKFPWWEFWDGQTEVRR